MRRSVILMVVAVCFVFTVSSMAWAAPTFPNNVTPAEAIVMVEQLEAVILDVRTSPEYALVGHPKWTDEDGTEHEAINVPYWFWGVNVGNIDNPGVVDQGLAEKYGQDIYYPRDGDAGSVTSFIDDVEMAIPDRTTPVIIMCRSGQRSCYAAYYLLEADYAEVYNMLGGFEGDKANADNTPPYVKESWYGQRRIVNGWQADNPNTPGYSGLPYGYSKGYMR